MYKSHIKKRIYTNNFLSCLKAQICTNFINGKKNLHRKRCKVWFANKTKKCVPYVFVNFCTIIKYAYLF